MAKANESARMDAARTMRAIVLAERLVVDLEAHTDMLREMIEEERGIDDNS